MIWWRFHIVSCCHVSMVGACTYIETATFQPKFPSYTIRRVTHPKWIETTAATRYALKGKSQLAFAQHATSSKCYLRGNQMMMSSCLKLYILMWMYIIVKYIGACVWRVKSIWITRACVTNIAISLNSRENVCIENPSQYAVGTYLLRTYALYGKLYGDLEMLASAVLNKSTIHSRAVVANRMRSAAFKMRLAARYNCF